MEDALLTDVPERDRAEIERYIESHGGAIVLRVGDKLGSDAKAAMLAYRKRHGELPPYDTVWIGEGTLGVASMDQIDAALHELRDAHAERVALESRIAEARRSLHPRFHFWWGGVMVGGGAVFALEHRYWPAWAALLAFGLIFTWQGRRGLD